MFTKKCKTKETRIESKNAGVGEICQISLLTLSTYLGLLYHLECFASATPCHMMTSSCSQLEPSGCGHPTWLNNIKHCIVRHELNYLRLCSQIIYMLRLISLYSTLRIWLEIKFESNIFFKHQFALIIHKTFIKTNRIKVS